MSEKKIWYENLNKRPYLLFVDIFNQSNLKVIDSKINLFKFKKQ